MGSYGYSAAIKGKVIFVLGASGTAKSNLAIGLANKFGGEMINSDKMQVYDSHNDHNQQTHFQRTCCCQTPPPQRHPTRCRLLSNRPPHGCHPGGRVHHSTWKEPIIVGGSNRYIEELVKGEGRELMLKYECCFLWMDVKKKVLHEFVAEPVASMVEHALVEDVRRFSDPNGSYTKGVRRSIGVTEMVRFFRAEEGVGEEERARLSEVSFQEIMKNTGSLTCCKWAKIKSLRSVVGWTVKRIDATEVFRRRKEVGAREEVWEEMVMKW